MSNSLVALASEFDEDVLFAVDAVEMVTGEPASTLDVVDARVDQGISQDFLLDRVLFAEARLSALGLLLTARTLERGAAGHRVTPSGREQLVLARRRWAQRSETRESEPQAQMRTQVP